MNGYVRGLMFEATGRYAHGAMIVFNYADEESEPITVAVTELPDMMDWKPIGECWFPASFLPQQTLGETEEVWELKHLKQQMPHLKIWENGDCC